MRSSIRLGKIFGVEIGLHYSWLLIAGLIATSLAGHFQSMHPEWSGGVVWASSALTALLFFAALVGHELSHALVARAEGLPVRSITLFALGGVAQIEREAETAKSEFWMAVVGPLASAAIGGACLGIARALGWAWMSDPETPALAVLVWLGFINFSLAAFNMIPGFPLDGGRVLHAVVWWITGNAQRSIRIAAQVGRVVALLFIGYGLFRFLTGYGFGGLWLAFIGWFLLDAAGTSYTQVRITEALRGVRVRDLMIRDCATVDLHANLEAFIESGLKRSGSVCYLVVYDNQPVGLISHREVRDIPRPQWPFRSVGDVMQPLEEMHPVPPDMPVSDALEEMGRERINQLPVAQNGRLEGILSRASVLGFLQGRLQPQR